MDRSKRASAKRASELALKKLINEAKNTFARIGEDTKQLGECAQVPISPVTVDTISDSRSDFSADDYKNASSKGLICELREQTNHNGNINGHDYVVDSKKVELELHQARKVFPNLVNDYRRMEQDLKKMWEQSLLDTHEHVKRVEDLELELETARNTVQVKKQSEWVLRKSLEESLSLVRPLKGLLETAEEENTLYTKELKASRRHIARLEHDNQDDTQSSKRKMGYIEKFKRRNRPAKI